MNPLTTSEITAACVNATRSEIKAIAFPQDLDATPWNDLDFFGWRDPRIARRGYLVAVHGQRLVTVALSTPENRMSGRRKAMCVICRAVDNGSNIALFAARRIGAAGRRGDIVGTYICTGLDCSMQLRHPTRRAGRTIIEDGLPDDDARASAMLDRLATFLDSVGVPR